MRFQFLHKYFKKESLKDFDNEIYINITETPTFNIKEEDYSLRIETCQESNTHRKYAVEHHLGQKHNKPHLQFKFHSEKIGSIWINLIFETEEEYKKGIEGFIFHSKNIFKELENEHKNLCEEMMHLKEVESLAKEGEFLQEKVTQSIKKGFIEFQNCLDEKRKELIQNHELLNMFVGEKNIQLLLKK